MGKTTAPVEGEVDSERQKVGNRFPGADSLELSLNNRL